MSGRPLSIGPKTGCHTSIPLSSTGGSGPTSGRKGHYRPFSTLHTQSSCPSSDIRQSASPSGLHQFRNSMGFQFGSKGRKELVRANSSSSDCPSSLRPTKRRSMTSIFATADALSPPLSPSSGCSDALPVINISKKQVSYEENELDPCDNFIPKNIWAKRCNMKLHPYPKQVVYMQAYDPISLESDRYTELLFQRLSNGSPSFHDYQNKPPAMVLDLGCGQGHWILHGANMWRDTEFVGLDIVDITLPAFRTLDNVRLVQGDFLNYKLPFPDNTFDLVRMANLALCIPYDQWEFVFGQVHRVLTPGGRLELIDDDIYFPYGQDWKKLETFVPASPHSGFCPVKRDEDMDADSILTNPAVSNISGVADSGPTTSDLPSTNIRLDRSRSHYALGKQLPLQPPALLKGLLSMPTRPSDLTSLVANMKPTSPPTSGHLRQCSGSKTIRSVQTNSSSTTKNRGNPVNLPPRPKRTREKVAPLPSIRSITPTFSLSSGAGYSPIWSLRTVDTAISSDTSSVRTTDTSPPASIRSVVNKSESNISAWQRKVSASKNMESLFEKMLMEQHGIHLRPVEFLLPVLGKVFDDHGAEETRARMKESFHIKLASIPTGDRKDDGHVGMKRKGRNSIDEADGAASTNIWTDSTRSTTVPENQNTLVTSLRSKTWEQGQSKGSKQSWPRSVKEKDRQHKKLEERRSQQSRPKKIQAVAVNSAASLFRKSRLQDPSMSTPVRPALSAKAAVILGIPYSELSVVTSSLSHSSSKLVIPPPFPRSNLSAKAAGRLGIPYSKALSAAASFSVPYSTESSSFLSRSPTTNSESTSSCEPVQHTGLLIWPNTHVPMAVGELEMHACKYIHTLLGCRPALEEFIAKFVDERGKRFVGEEELKDEIWEYECFRRARFNWPSEVAEPYEDDPATPNAAEPSSPVHNSNGTGGTVDSNRPTANALDLPALQIAATADDFGGFSTETLLRSTRSSLSTVNRRRSPSIPMKVKFQTMPLLSPAPFSCLVPSYLRMEASDELMTGAKVLDDLVHLRSIRVFEGVKAA